MSEERNRSDPDDLRAHFSRELRRLRLRTGLSMAKLAEELGCTPQWICQLEKAEKPPSEQTTLDLDTFFKTDGWEENDGHFHRIYAAMRSASPRRALRPGFKAYLVQEAKAIGVRCFAAQTVPGLLQTEGYAQAIMDPSAPSETLDARVVGRIARQELLIRDKPAMTTFILDESVLRRPVGGNEVMTEQIDHMISMAQSPYNQVLIMPYDRVTPEALAGGLILLSFEKKADLAYIESGVIGVLIDSRDEVFMTGVYFNKMMGEALSQGESIEFMRRAQEAYQ